MKLYWLQGCIRAGVAGLMPASVALASQMALGGRLIAAVVIAGAIAFGTTLDSYITGNPPPGYRPPSPAPPVEPPPIT